MARSLEPWVLLLVDDEPDVIKTSKLLVEDFFEGVTVLTASSGRQGLDILASGRVHVVVADYKMPAMDGFEFLAHVKRLHPAVRRMMFTSFPENGLERRAESEDVVEDFLSKKLDPSEFLWAVAALIQQTQFSLRV